MAVVIGQSRATAHVYRMFGALLAMLLLMAVAVAVIRVRSDHLAGSPYGALAGLAGHPETAPAAAPADASQRQAAAVATAPIATASSPAPAIPEAVPPAGTAGPVEAARPAMPRQIALGREAAAASATQPAPPALVAAAVAAAAAPPRTPAAAPPPVAAQPAEPVAPFPAAPASAEKVAALPATDAAPATGRININTASVEQLNTLPGVGRIGRWIANHRPYRSIDDLVDRRVLKARDFARIRAVISTN